MVKKVADNDKKDFLAQKILEQASSKLPLYPSINFLQAEQ